MPQPQPIPARSTAVPDRAGTSGGDAKTGLDGLLDPINAALRQACEFGEGCPEELASAIRYALLAPGKRLRPAMTLMAAEACGGRIESAMPAAVAVEMVHAYSLIHDDLPAMDDDDLRRGKPTVHIEFDEATAILAGDALQAEAFGHLCKHVENPDQLAESARVLAHAVGAANLVGGQADDLAAEGWISSQSRTLERLESIHRRKTGALFAAAIDLGAILGGAKPETRAVLSNYARDLGLAFQVVDDLLDATATAESLGKRAGKDAERGKLTYTGLLGVQQARDKAAELVASARTHSAVFGDAGWRLSWLADYVLEREN